MMSIYFNNNNTSQQQQTSNSNTENESINNTRTRTNNDSNTTQQQQNNIWTDPNDDFDSDQLDEDESYSWASDNQDALGSNNPNSNTLTGCSSSIANWRDWKSSNISDLFMSNLNILPTSNRSNNNSNTQLNYLINHSNSNKNLKLLKNSCNNSNILKIDKLVDLCAKYVASNIPFELVETFREPVPEDLQLKITFASFPDNIENIRLYSCLANGNADEYLRGEQLYRNRCVKKIIQIGFHLSAQVSPLNGLGTTNSNNTNQSNSKQTSNLFGNLAGFNSNILNVAIVCDRKRIVSCSCTCSKQAISWCSHIVSVCLYRILEPLNVEYRAPVSESLSKLKRDQLQKFAQYLISELPQQVLPTAQKLLDELLKSDETSINLLSGAPDPTAGASQNDISIWCLDENILQENIRKTLIKFIAPTPNVVSDIECLEHASSATAAEYTSLLRPLRGREPEGMWNLISIIREMFRQRDKNSIPLLRILTNECLNIEQIVQLWFLVKSSQLHQDKALFNSVSTSLNNPRNSNSSLTTQVHQACSNLMDEIVSLWKISCLNPLLNDFDEKQTYKCQLEEWNQNVYDRLKKFFNSMLNSVNSNMWSNNTNNMINYEKLLKKLDTDLFCSFLPSILACEMTWFDFEIDSMNLFKLQCVKLLEEIKSDYIALNEMKLGSENDVQKEQNLTYSNQNQSVNDQTNQSDLNQLYQFDFDPSKLRHQQQSQSSTETSKLNLKLKNLTDINLDKLEILFLRCEALHSHGFYQHSCEMAQILAGYILNGDLNLNQSKPITSSGTNRHRLINNFQNTILFRSYLLCNILYESLNKFNSSERDRLNNLAFKIGIYGLETSRPAAISKALEVKLINQEQDLVNLLKKFQIGSNEISLLREKAIYLRDNYNRNQNNLTLPIMLGSFIFDILYNFDQNQDDQQLAFDASLTVLGLKSSLSESQHSILCEGIRRQKGELALMLLLTFKDDEQRLLKIMDKILDKDVHNLFRQTNTINFNPFNPNFKKIQQQQLQDFIQLGLDDTVTQQESSNIQQTQLINLTKTNQSKFSLKPTSAIDSLSSGWEESENESSNLSGDVSLLETKHRCMSLNKQQPSITSSDNSPNNNSNRKIISAVVNKNLKSIDDSGDDSSSSNETNKTNTQNQLNQSSQIENPTYQNKSTNRTANFNTSKFNYNNLINQMNNSNLNRSQQPSEALAHFMFEFSKTVLSKAGGSVSTSVFLNHQTHQQGSGPHRNLHICSFLISLYALGLHNCVQPSWLSRTYSSHVTWVNSQAVDIGYTAICILIECWQGHLTPSECVSLADRVSRGRDNMAVKAAAELALSSLRYAHLMNLTEIQRALLQCKEQSKEMLQRACIIVENAVKDANSANLLDILFSIAKRWDELFIETSRDMSQLNNSSNLTDLTQPVHTNNNTQNNNFGIVNFNLDQLINLNKNQNFNNPTQFATQFPNQIQIPPVLMQTPIFIPQQNNINPTNSQTAPNTQFVPFYNSPQPQQFNNVVDTNPTQNLYQLNQMINLQQQNFIQNFLKQQQQHVQQTQPTQSQQAMSSTQTQPAKESTDNVSLKHLITAFRVGMLGLEALPRRADGSHQIKYRQSPPYADDVKWLWEVAIKLDSQLKTNNTNLQQFCQTASIVLQNPFLIQEIVFETTNYLCRNNPSQFSMILCSPILSNLVQRCLNLYFRCCMSKLHHLTPNEHEDFINMLLTARNIFYYSGNMNYFSDLVQNLRRSNKCKKDVWNKICNSLNNQ